MKTFDHLLVVLVIRSQGLGAQCRLLGITYLTSEVPWLTTASFAFAWHQPLQKVTLGFFEWEKTGYRGS